MLGGVEGMASSLAHDATESSLRYALRLRREMHHLIQIQQVYISAWLTIPNLYLYDAAYNHDEKAFRFAPLTRYFIENPEMSHKNRIYTARAIGMLYDYAVQCGISYLRNARINRRLAQHEFVSDFVLSLRYGTIQNGSDPTGLYWIPSSSRRNAEDLLRALEKFLDYIAETSLPSPFTDVTMHSNSRPRRIGYFTQHLYKLRIKNNISFLSHIKSNIVRNAEISRPAIGRSDQSFKGSQLSVFSFPQRYIFPFLEYGFQVGKCHNEDPFRIDMVGLIHAALLFGGGLRSSEALHIWVSDVQVVDGRLVVFLHHPAHSMISAGAVNSGHPATTIAMSRERYLRLYCGMAPRHLVYGPAHAGFKGMRLGSSHWAPLYWLPIGDIDIWTKPYLQTYLQEVRPALMAKRRQRGLPDHPFLLVCGANSRDPDHEASIGNPYTEAAFRGSWRRALARLKSRYGDPGLEYRKSLGTTPHGARHAYGRILAELGTPADVIQECMRHVSPFSQLTYTRPHSPRVAAELEAARVRLESSTVPERNEESGELADQLHSLKYGFQQWNR